MKHIAALSREEREELFFNTAHKVGMPPAADSHLNRPA